MKNPCQNLIQQYQNITLLKQEFHFICKKGLETKDFTKLKEVKKELGRRVKELKEQLESEEYLNEKIVYLEKNMTRRSKRVIIQLQKALNEGAEEMGKEPEVIGEDSFGGYSGQIQIDNAGKIAVLDLRNTKITSLDNVRLPEGLEHLILNNTKITSLDKVNLPAGLESLDLANTPLEEDEVKLQALKAKYPKIHVYV